MAEPTGKRFPYACAATLVRDGRRFRCGAPTVLTVAVAPSGFALPICERCLELRYPGVTARGGIPKDAA